MHATNFEGSDTTLGPPEGMTEDEVNTIFAQELEWGDKPAYLTCWKPTQAELEEIQKTGRLWLLVLGHMPPALILGFDPRIKK